MNLIGCNVVTPVHVTAYKTKKEKKEKGTLPSKGEILPLVVGPPSVPVWACYEFGEGKRHLMGHGKPSWAQVHGKGFNMGCKMELTSWDQGDGPEVSWPHRVLNRALSTSRLPAHVTWALLITPALAFPSTLAPHGPTHCSPPMKHRDI